MTLGAQILGLALMGLIYGLLIPLLMRWIDSGVLVTVICVLLFVPVFMASHGLADVLSDFYPRKQEEEE